ncbi:MAG: LacI family DNA-binding transcriptional regulator [Christensenellales bacterium]|jgi:LacI family transcriptional regulator
MKKMKRTTINDVAELAGVSSATVSHVINDTRFVSDELKTKVYEAIQQLNFSPDSHAKKFRTGIKKIIGLIVPDNSNYYFSTLIEKVEEIVSEKGYNIIICNTKEIKEREKKYIKLLSSGLVDGILLASTIEDFEELSDVLPTDFPVVLVDRIIKNAPLDTVTISTFQSVYQGACDLIRNGHRRIGYIDVDLPYLSPAVERLEGFRRAMMDSDIEIQEDMVQLLDIEAGTVSSGSISRCIDTLISNQITAIVVVNSDIALKTIFYLEWGKQIRVGKDIDLVCFNSYYLFNLTQINFIDRPVAEMGRQAGNQILKRIESPSAPIKKIVLPSLYTNKSLSEK